MLNIVLISPTKFVPLEVDVVVMIDDDIYLFNYDAKFALNIILNCQNGTAVKKISA